MYTARKTTNSKKTILHITPHLGGGVGRVLLNYLETVKSDPFFVHKILCLEYANEKARVASEAIGFSLTDNISSDHGAIIAAIAVADITLVHWWNHPLLFDFLVRETLPPSRIIFWSHISGFHAPYVFTQPVLEYPDFFVFTTPISLEVSEVKQFQNKRNKDFRVIWSTGGIEHAASIKPATHSGFVVGYIGTVDYGKMHPDFLKMSGLIRIPERRFIVCGGPNEKQVRLESLRYEIGPRCTFTGQITDIARYLSQFDVFGYPLAPYHYGTCEQSLGESMAAGVVPVVLANPAESSIIKNGVTGITAKNGEEYARGIETLHRDPELRGRLSRNCRKAAAERYSSNAMVNRWNDVFSEALLINKTGRKWPGPQSGKNALPHDVYVESLGPYAKEFAESLRARTEQERKTAEEGITKLYGTSHLWRSSTRGTPRHYSYFFPEDLFLKSWSDLAAQTGPGV